MFFDDIYPESEISNIKSSCVAEACGSSAEAFGGSKNLKHQTNSCVAEACGRLRKAFRGSKNFRHQKTHVLRKLAEACGSRFAEAEFPDQHFPLSF